jgi:hypothetical protein
MVRDKYRFVFVGRGGYEFFARVHRRLAGTFLKRFVARCLTDAVTNIAEIKKSHYLKPSTISSLANIVSDVSQIFLRHSIKDKKY